NFPSCDSEDCRKSVTRQKGYFYCESCNKRVDIPIYRLELDVSDDTSQTVVVMFDETTTALVGCLAGSLMDIEDKMIMLVRAPSVATPSKPSEPKRTKSLVIEDSDAEAIGDSSRYAGKNNVDPLSDNNKRKRKLIEDSTGDVSGGTPKGGNTDRRGSQSDKKKGVVCRMLGRRPRHPYRNALAGGRARLADLGKKYSDISPPSSCAVKFRHKLYSGMNACSSNDPMVIPSLSTMLHKSVLIASKTIVGQDGRVHTIKPPKRAALTSAGPLSYQGARCDATMWYAERTNKAKRVAHPTFSLCCQEEGVPPRYAQLYFFDMHNEIKNRMSAFVDKETSEKVDENIVAWLIQMLDRSSALA
ncbi:nucleic acid-binding, OB-fold protein, partial [Tanacetum coccineum]